MSRIDLNIAELIDKPVIYCEKFNAKITLDACIIKQEKAKEAATIVWAKEPRIPLSDESLNRLLICGQCPVMFDGKQKTTVAVNLLFKRIGNKLEESRL